ncbi:MAG TPA: LLM class flavin-dependent oxidoreductase, partial [Candidatus Limnocylindria bacterium]|nr:LLM class flavin-dependent oxidoreductase [Candidatus Limnocylindria bacterium]
MERAGTGRLSFGITAGPRPWLAALGGSVERLGYATLWTNDTRGRSAAAALAPLGAAPRTLGLAIGVAALSDRTPEAIADDLERSGLPLDRLVIGVGSGASRSLALVRAGVAGLRALLPGQPIAVAAVGPRMCRLAGEIADLVLLNWARPDRIEWARERVASGAATAGRPAPTVAAYVRVALGPGARERLEREAARYARRSPWYAEVLAERDAAPVGVAVEESDEVRERLAMALDPYRAVLDETVVRGLPGS